MVLLVVSIADILFPLDTVYCSFPFLELFFLFHCSNFLLANLYRTFIAAIPPLVSFHCFLRAFFFIVFESSSMVFLIAASLFELFSRILEFLQFFENFSSHVLDSFHVTGISPFFLFLEFRSSTSLKFLPPLPCLIIGIHSLVSIIAFLLLAFLSFFDDCFYIWNFSFIRFLWGHSVVRKIASTNVEKFPSSNLIKADCIPRILLSKGSPLFGSLFLFFTVNVEW